MAAQRKGCLWWVGLAVVILVGLAVLGVAIGSSDDDEPASSRPSFTSGRTADPTTTLPPVNPGTITADEFARLTDGMTYEAAVEIIGGPGEVLSEINLGGIHTIMYMWEGDKFVSNANAMFQDNALISKAQFGL